MSDEDEFREIARYDWLEITGGSRLHAPFAYQYSGWLATSVTFECGTHADTAHIPGLESRIRRPRCAQCCDRLGYPRGVGSPKDDDQCRELLGLDKEVPF